MTRDTSEPRRIYVKKPTIITLVQCKITENFPSTFLRKKQKETMVHDDLHSRKSRF